ncbi:CmpA/NrtA family ABC transporter substrate-binding protein [Actibacterium sp. 188UL27-1]|uniref:CmpA/NrtA family ABC transporter substrate-binding protein n=1 Tax=Actibacterium sp. 188UL27-1 TaxID=2786961 RepID=UPI00195B7C9D|nr:CmpA/NrtA family ABC transporter substrate-binding protein [Actibacterium sp. 188UL27-1]MBM7068888.1 ABC transporter substrate-binding protein [Actibacterium sp. 188UL27-1]
MTPQQLDCGYVPLVDSAPLIIARALNFDIEEGIRLNLLRQPSWSALRDLLALGHLDCAQMLSPLPIAMSLGLGGIPCRIDALMVLSVNGNTIGVSTALAQMMRAEGWHGGFQTPMETGHALLGSARNPLRIGVPFPFSMHTELLHIWLQGCDLPDPGMLQIITIPPPRMAEAVADNQIDAFCVGEPWGSQTVEAQVGELILPGSAIWQFAPEKVLAVRHRWTDEAPQTTAALMRAVFRACRWLDQKDNRTLASEILARSEHLDLPDAVIDRALMGRIVPSPGSIGEDVTGFLHFARSGATFPWRSQAAWIAHRLAPRHGLDRAASIATAKACFRPDLYRANLAPLGVDMPGASEKLEGSMIHRTAVASVKGDMILGPDAFFDGAIFDPASS